MYVRKIKVMSICSHKIYQLRNAVFYCSLLLSVGALPFFSCENNDDSTVNEPGIVNSAPAFFNLISVDNNATAVAVLPLLEWEASVDPDGDPVTYSLLMDASETPTTVIAEGLSTTSFQLQERLSLFTTYSWRVVANDNNGNITRTAINTFTTRNLRMPETPLTTNAGFLRREDHASVVFDNKLWVIGGGTISANDVWSSIDGINWTVMNENAFSNVNRKRGHASVVFNNRIWVTGGSNLSVDGSQSFDTNDVWSSEDGINWTQILETAPFSARKDHAMVVFNNKMWIIGGRTTRSNNISAPLNDVWSSEDGINWTQVLENAPFPKTSNHTTVVFNDNIWLISARNDFDNIWSSEDGVNWTLVLEDAPFSNREAHTSVIFDNKLWVIGGLTNLITGDSLATDIWFSEDGTNWIQFVEEAPFSTRANHSTAVFDNGIYIIAGRDSTNPFSVANDIWVLD